jgi:hypothetical protein
METKLYKQQVENFETILAYHNEVRDKAQQYSKIISKFREYTNNYYLNLKDLLKLEDDNISNENESLNKYKTISIDLSQKRARKSTKNFNGDNDNNIKIEKKIDVMPIQNSINKINIFFQKYMESLELINAGLECKLNELKLKMERTQSEINVIKNDYSVDKDTFLKKYSKFDSLNKRLKDEYETAEEKVSELTLKKKSIINNRDKESEIENDINVTLLDIKSNQKEIMKKYKPFNNFSKIFNDSSNQKIEEMKKNVINLYGNFYTCLNDFLILYKKFFMLPIEEINNQQKRENNGQNIFNDLLNNNIKKIDEKEYNINFDEYKLNVVQKRKNKKQKNEGRKSIKVIKNTNDLENKNKNLNNLEEEDIYYIAKKMYNFEFVDKKDYILNIEKEKLILKEKIERLTTYKKYKKEQLTDKKINIIEKNEINPNKEVNNDINITDNIGNKEKNDKVEEIKENQNQKDDTKEKKDINIIEKEEEYGIYEINDNNELIEKNDLNKKNEKIIENNKNNEEEKEFTQNDADYIIKLMPIKEYRIYFLTKINNFRSTGAFIMPEKKFDYIIQIFKEISKYLWIEDKSKEKKEIILDKETTQFTIILSQTFCKLKGEKKIYIQNELSDLDIYHCDDFWKTVIKTNIEKEIKNCMTNDVKIGKEEDEESIRERRNSISFAQIIPQISGMYGFGLNKDKIKNIIMPFIDEYNINEENKNTILNIINNPNI